MGLVEKVFGSKSKLKLLRVFYDNPKREFCLDDLRRILKCSVGTIYPSLSTLADLRVIIARKAGRSTFYKLNFKNPIVKKMVEIFDSEAQFLINMAKEFVERIDKNQIISVILFGSVIRGEATERSDIDLLIVYDKDRETVEKNVSELSDKFLEKDIIVSPIFLSKEEVLDMIKKYNSFVLRIQEEGKVVFGKSLKEIEHD